MLSVAVRVKSLGKQKMGAWTSAFMIGISNLSGQALPCNPIPINLNCNPILQWGLLYTAN
jgi:hypothetical protein